VVEFRAGSATALEELVALHARDALRSESMSAPNSALREYAISALAELRDADDLEFLLDRFCDSDVQDVAQASVEEEWGEAAEPALIARLAGCDNDCLSLIEALEHVGTASALEPLAATLAHQDPTTAEWAAGAIAAIGKRTGEHVRAIALLEGGLEANRNPYVRETIDAEIVSLRDAAG
jgi:HEAT repeat protein